MNVRKTLAAALLAGATVLVVAGCSDDTTDTVSSAANDASAAVASAASDAKQAVVGLKTDDAQVILRKAVDPATSSTELDAVVDTSNPVSKGAIQAYAKASNMAGYTPEIYTVKEVKADGDDKAVATVSVKSPHSPEPVDITLAYVKVDGDWKLAGSAVTQLTSMGGQHGG
ncbi:DUF4878 domain-containing protein [Gordonia insulae]|uniref:Low molecular weight antigen MTB12-like C-terminal domain-containing protein n=1 Tax=Gordonia insulae TaxID=2420509 RepID=A0A3G8JTA0_9ACTN|nr:DUF4878 domain-containing protein [Gordonia insulae]AZG48361.1 hypothetical protein D7316_04978 [Gordonia insulae]